MSPSVPVLLSVELGVAPATPAGASYTDASNPAGDLRLLPIAAPNRIEGAMYCHRWIGMSVAGQAVKFIP